VADNEFFGEKRAAAVLKHGLLSRYVPIFATKVGSQSKDSRVVVLDGYAGEGRYDGSPGSPIVMMQTAQKMADKRRIELHFVAACADAIATSFDMILLPAFCLSPATAARKRIRTLRPLAGVILLRLIVRPPFVRRCRP
jgi:hypothetical protein